ncbi:MAG: putative penicillin acylase [Actinomycetia bacterium]|nr:putative penicillin acylase [Actinomycetes bacterium]
MSLVALVALVVAAGPVASAATTDPSTTTVPATTARSTAAAASGNYHGSGDAGGFRNIFAPGQDENLTPDELQQAAAAFAANDPTGFPSHFADQRVAYDALTGAAPNVTTATLDQFFKDESFGVKANDIARVYDPQPDVTVIRDKSSGVPHIYGRTRYGALFGEGYTTAEDRLLAADVLRRVGRANLTALVGPAGLSRDQTGIAAAPYSDADLDKQVTQLERSGPQGKALVADLRAYTAGINAFITKTTQDPSLLPAEYQLLGQKPQPWTPSDTIAVAAVVGSIFGKGGGNEVNNECGLAAMTAATGSAAAARKVFDDLHFVNDPGAPTTSSHSAPYDDDLGPVQPAAVPSVDCASLTAAGSTRPPTTGKVLAGVTSFPAAGTGSAAASTAVATPTTRAQAVDDVLALAPDPADATPSMSNALLVSGSHTKSGKPIAVFGPQVGYNVPGLLMEKDVHGPGIDARGVGFAGADLYVQLGRGADFAFSATSSGADNIDSFVLNLCDPSGGAATTASEGYLRKGSCVAIQTFDHETIAPDGTTYTWHIERSPDYGPIVERGTLTSGRPIAIAQKRSTYGDELGSAAGFKQLNDPRFMKGGYDAFRTAAHSIDYTFNWLYVDATTIGYQHSGKVPLRAKGVDPDLPTIGDGTHDWHGYLAGAAQPWEVNPDAGFLASWNNQQAPGFRPSDAQWSFGPLHRVTLLDERLENLIKTKNKSIVPADVVNAMGDAGTVDLRAEQVLPLLLRVMTSDSAPADDRLLAMREELELWAKAGGHRKDTNADGAYEDGAAIAVLDAWWKPLTDAIFGGAVGTPFESLKLTVDDNPQDHKGSAFDNGSYGAVLQDLRVILGEKTSGGWHNAYCGRTATAAASLAACRTVLWSSLAQAADALTTQFSSPLPARWVRVPADDEIRFDPLLAKALPMRWINRPTFQQVVQLHSRGQAKKPGKDSRR